MTYAVGTARPVVDGHLLAVDSDAVRAAGREALPARSSRRSSAARRDAPAAVSMLRPVWFTPTVEQSDAGADWYRCDVIAVAGRRPAGHARRRPARAPWTAAGRRTGTPCAAPPSPARPASAGDLPGDHSLAGGLGPRPRRPAGEAAPTPARPAVRGRRPGRLPGRRPARSPATRSTSRGATSGPPPSSGRPARPTVCCWVPATPLSRDPLDPRPRSP